MLPNQNNKIIRKFSYRRVKFIESEKKIKNRHFLEIYNNNKPDYMCNL